MSQQDNRLLIAEGFFESYRSHVTAGGDMAFVAFCNHMSRRDVLTGKYEADRISTDEADELNALEDELFPDLRWNN